MAVADAQLLAYADPAGGQGWTPEQTRREIVNAAVNLRLDPALMLSLAQQESGFDPTATSPTNVSGLFQVTTATGKQYGQLPAARTDPRVSMHAGMGYFRDLLAQNKGDVRKALMDYNGGSDPVFDQNVLRHYQANAGGLEPTPANMSLMRKTAAYLPQGQPQAMSDDQLLSIASGGGKAAPQAAAPALPGDDELLKLAIGGQAAQAPASEIAPTAPATLAPAGQLQVNPRALQDPMDLVQGQRQFGTTPARPPLAGGDIGGGVIRATIGGPLQGAMQTLGLPADLLNLALQGAGALEQAYPEVAQALVPGQPIISPETALAPQVPGGTADINRATRALMERAGINPADILDPQNGVERFAQSVIREATGAALPIGVIGGMAKLAQVPARSIPALARLGQEGSVLDLLATMPLADLAQVQAMYGAAQGVGGEVGRGVGGATFGQEGEAPGLLIGQLLGSLSPDAVAKMARVVKAMPGTISRAFNRPDTVEREVQNLIRDTLLSEGARPIQNLEQAQDIQQAIPGMRPTLGQATGSPALLQTEASLAGRSPSAQVAREAQQAGTQRVLSEAAEQRVGQATQGADLGETRAALQAQRQAEEARIAQPAQQAEYELRQAQDRAARMQQAGQRRVAMSQEQAIEEAKRLRTEGWTDGEIRATTGETVRRVLREERQKAQVASKKDYTAVDPMDIVLGNVDTTYDDLRQVAAQAVANGQPVPQQVQRTLKALETRAARHKGGIEDIKMTPDQERMAADADLELQSFIRRKGGIRMDEELPGEVRGLVSNRETGTTGLLNRNGMSLDDMAQEAQQAGFIDGADKVELLDALRESQRTGKYYSVRNSMIDDVFGEAFGAPEAVARTQGVALDPGDIAQTPITFMEMHALRSKLLRAQRETQDPATAQVLSNSIAKIDRKMQVLAEESGDVGILDRYRTAQERYKRNVVPFMQGPSQEVLQRQNGVYKIPNEDVVARFWHTTGMGTQADAQAFTQLLGNRQDAVDALTQYATNSLYLKATKDGVLDLAKADAWRKQNESLLAMFPEVEAQFNSARGMQQKVKDIEAAAVKLDTEHLEDVAGAEQALKAAQKVESVQRKQLDQHIVSALVGDNYQQRLETLMRSRKGDSTQELLKMADAVKHDEQAGRGLIQGMWDAYNAQLPKNAKRIPESDLPVHNPEQLRRFVGEYAPILVQVGGPEFVRDLYTITQGMEIAQRQASGTGMDLARKLNEVHTGDRIVRYGIPTAAVALGSKIAGVPGGIAGLALSEGMRAWMLQGGAKRAELVDRMLQQELFNPDVAKTLALMRQANVSPKQIVPRLYLHYLHLGQPSPGEEGFYRE